MDICMCTQEECKFKKKCYRHEARTDWLYQSIFTNMPIPKKKEDCEYFWAFKPKKDKIKGYIKKL